MLSGDLTCAGRPPETSALAVIPRCRKTLALATALAAAFASSCSRPGNLAGAAPTSYPTDEASLSRPLPQPVPEPVARVNGQPISVRQVLPMAKKELDQGPPGEVEQRKPAAVRRALLRYVERELLLQEAFARGIAAESRQVDWAYDQMRREHPDDAEWGVYLAGQGLDPQRLRTELRQQHTVAALVDAELAKEPVSEADARAAFDANPAAFTPAGASTVPPFEAVREATIAAVRETRRRAVAEALVAKLRAKARVEIYI